jgi:prepilin-type N-terminal cleavage/methylation domain-containing protein
MGRRRAFTLVEVLIAVVILGLAAAASLKLVAMSHRTLAEVRIQRELLTRGKEMQFEAMRGVLPESGRDDQLTWQLRNQTISILDDMWSVKFRTLELSMQGRKILLYQP